MSPLSPGKGDFSHNPRRKASAKKNLKSVAQVWDSCARLREVKLKEKTAKGFKEVMPMQDSSKCMGHQVEVRRLCAGAVL